MLLPSLLLMPWKAEFRPVASDCLPAVEPNAISAY
jgi:hypothetical protein